jgi:hypothetical protein
MIGYKPLCISLFPMHSTCPAHLRDLNFINVNILDDLLNIIGVIKSRNMGWLGHVACMVHVRNASAVILRKHEGKIPFGLVYTGEYYYN